MCVTSDVVDVVVAHVVDNIVVVMCGVVVMMIVPTVIVVGMCDIYYVFYIANMITVSCGMRNIDDYVVCDIVYVEIDVVVDNMRGIMCTPIVFVSCCVMKLLLRCLPYMLLLCVHCVMCVVV